MDELLSMACMKLPIPSKLGIETDQFIKPREAPDVNSNQAVRHILGGCWVVGWWSGSFDH